MKEYLLLFRNEAKPDGYATTTQDRAQDMPLWQSWIGNIAMQGKLVLTAPIEFAGETVTSGDSQDGPHRSAEGVLVSGFLICKADSIDEVRALCQSCPILRYANSSVEIRPLIPFAIG